MILWCKTSAQGSASRTPRRVAMYFILFSSESHSQDLLVTLSRNICDICYLIIWQSEPLPLRVLFKVMILGATELHGQIEHDLVTTCAQDLFSG